MTVKIERCQAAGSIWLVPQRVHQLQLQLQLLLLLLPLALPLSGISSNSHATRHKVLTIVEDLSTLCSGY